ncbi:postreplication repair E3 ubiquitin-protein ligase RAD18-like [Sipha flava]|uniref:Postreplication repair E3 ubiquitin-protein ligase RAD18-like n=1 Tax=Sipha flava TaxID=143950 RepID=A0A8B8GQL3_9HEMI|nr:postreplication repair E3 ubiquitin-protein ligase RAD18-like [Sipha flava]
MSKQIIFSNFLNKLEEYENSNFIWCADLIANGRQTLLSVFNSIDNEQLTNLVESFTKFLSLLTQYNPNSLTNENNILIQNEPTPKQNESQELLPKNDVIKIVNSDLQCPICNEWLFRATTVNCNHTFCETCIKKWLNINKACPVCRASIQYTSTSIAVDNFITNLCQLIGGFFKERRESIQNSRKCNNNSSTVDLTIDELINDLNISQSIVNDTYISQLETTIPMTHPNMVRLLPCPPTPVSRANLRQPIASSNTHHPNRVQLLPFPQSSTVISSRENRLQLPSSTSASNSRVNRLQPVPSTNVGSNVGLPTRHQSNIAILSPCHRTTSLK